MPKVSKNMPSYREHRPIDVLKKPQLSKAKQTDRSSLPDSWVTVLDAAEEWPYLDPDENGLTDPEPDFGLYPSDESSLPEIEPFSEDEPWGKMIRESAREYELFSHYRSLGITRTRTKTAEHFGISRNRVSQLAQERNWDARVQAWDDYRERIYTAELIAGVQEMAHEHSQVARQGIEALSVIFETIVANFETDEKKAQFLSELSNLPVKTQLLIAQGSARVIPALTNMERVSRGLPTEITAGLHLHEARVTVQSTDDLYAILTGLAGPLAVTRTIEVEEASGESDT